MTKIVRLTESDLVRLVKKIVNEQEENMFAKHDLVGGWRDKNDVRVDEPIDYGVEMSFGPEDYDDFMDFINGCDTTWCLKTKKMYQRYADKGNITVRR